MQPANAPPAGSSALASGPAGDPLSDVLRRVRVSGALMFLVDASDPWCVEIPPIERYRAALSPRPAHVLSYHVVLEGGGLASVPGEAPRRFGAGDILIFPQGDAYRMESAPGTPPEFGAEAVVPFFEGLVSGRVPFVVPEGGGGEPHAVFLCGFLTCDAAPFNPLLANLPRLLALSLPNRAEDTLARLIEVTRAEFRADRPGAAGVRLQLCELILVEALRRHILADGGPRGGWLGALADPVAGAAIREIHADPAADWTLARLAARVCASRSVLTERFRRSVGLPPMRYLTAWRMQLAAEQLRDGRASVAEVAWRVGYRSESAFSRAFRSATGQAPGAWRRAR